MSWIRKRIEAWQQQSTLVRTLWTTGALLLGCTLVVSATGYAAVSVTRAVFPQAPEETLATAALASEADADATDATAAPGTVKGTPVGRAKPGTRIGPPVKRTQARRGDSTE